MRTGMVALAAGLLLLRFLPALPDARWLIGLVLVGLLSLACRRYRVAMLLLGLSWACVSAQSALDDRLAPELDDRTLWLEGRVVGLPTVSDEVVPVSYTHLTLPTIYSV